MRTPHQEVPNTSVEEWIRRARSVASSRVVVAEFDRSHADAVGYICELIEDFLAAPEPPASLPQRRIEGERIKIALSPVALSHIRNGGNGVIGGRKTFGLAGYIEAVLELPPLSTGSSTGEETPNG